MEHTMTNHHLMTVDMIAECVIERRSVTRRTGTATWTTIATARVRLDKPGAEGVEDFVDAVAHLMRAEQLDSAGLRISAFVAATGDAVYTEIPAAADPAAIWSAPRRRTQHR
jgi:hypothetical protein